MEIVFLLVAGVLSVMAFRVSVGMGWHWGAALILGAIPMAAVLFLGIFGLLASAVFVGGLYKANA
jgi:hypothetical protein